MGIDESLIPAREILARANRVAVFSGAGLSEESGISTFRGREKDALWSRYDPMKLASVEGFAEDPERVIDWYNWRRSRLAEVNPNAAHVALASHPELINITQNVDDLLERAGVSETHIHHLHGTITKDRCNAACGVEESIALAHAPPLRHCWKCGALMRPAVVWFGETLPEQTWYQAARICRETDCLLVIGTSATVYPAAGLVETAAGSGSKIIVINAEPSAAGQQAHVELVGRAGQVLPPLLEGLRLRS